jgi:hypothetical protein
MGRAHSYAAASSISQLMAATDRRWVAGGHISSFLLHQEAFRNAVVDALRRVPADWLRHWEQPQPRSPASASAAAAAASASPSPSSSAPTAGTHTSD